MFCLLFRRERLETLQKQMHRFRMLCVVCHASIQVIAVYSHVSFIDSGDRLGRFYQTCITPAGISCFNLGCDMQQGKCWPWWFYFGCAQVFLKVFYVLIQCSYIKGKHSMLPPPTILATECWLVCVLLSSLKMPFFNTLKVQNIFIH